MTRDEHLEWSKKRAREYISAGNISEAWASMLSDTGKHPELVTHSGRTLGTMLMMGGHLKTSKEVLDFIEGFN